MADRIMYVAEGTDTDKLGTMYLIMRYFVVGYAVPPADQYGVWGYRRSPEDASAVASRLNAKRMPWERM